MNQVLRPLNVFKMKPTHNQLSPEKNVQVQSMIYLKQVNKLRVEKGERGSVKKIKEKLMKRGMKFLRTKRNYEELYDTSPRRKVVKLQTARIGIDEWVSLGLEDFRVRKCCVNSLHSSRRGSLGV